MNFIKTSLIRRLNITGIYTLHYFEYAKDFKFLGEKHNFWEMVYVDRGEVSVISETKIYKLVQGDAIFHKPNEYHTIWANNKFGNVVVITFDSDSAPMKFFEDNIVVLNSKQKAILANIVDIGGKTFLEPQNLIGQRELMRNKACFFGNEQILLNYLEILLLSMIEKNDISPKESRIAIDKDVASKIYITDSIIRILNENLYANLCFSDIAKNTCFSKSYITRLFKKNVNKGVMEYYLDLKIGEAKRLISKRELNFTQIANMLCFSSIHYFSRVFKIKTGLSPLEYSKSIKSIQIL